MTGSGQGFTGGLADSAKRMKNIAGAFEWTEQNHADLPNTAESLADFIGVPLSKYKLVTSFLDACDRVSSSKSRFMMAVSDFASLVAMRVARDPQVRDLGTAVACMDRAIDESAVDTPEARDRSCLRGRTSLEEIFNDHRHAVGITDPYAVERTVQMMKLGARTMLEQHFGEDPNSARSHFGTDYGAAVALMALTVATARPKAQLT